MDTRATMVKAAVVLALTVMAAQAAAAPPIIASAELGAGGTTLVLAGVNFAVSPTDIEDPGAGAQAPPGVSLALTPLPVTASSATSVTAALPATLAAGTYLVVLTRSDGEMAVSYLTTRAVGPQGSPGVAGPAGPAGRKGMPGAPGMTTPDCARRRMLRFRNGWRASTGSSVAPARRLRCRQSRPPESQGWPCSCWPRAVRGFAAGGGCWSRLRPSE